MSSEARCFFKEEQKPRLWKFISAVYIFCTSSLFSKVMSAKVTLILVCCGEQRKGLYGCFGELCSLKVVAVVFGKKELQWEMKF